MKARILVYVSSARAVPLREGSNHATGVFLGELTEPLEPMLAAGHHIEFVSPDGRGPHIDQNSFRLMYWRFNGKALRHARKVYERLQAIGIEKPQKLSDLLENPATLAGYDSLFIPGGHAPMTDVLYQNWLEGEQLNAATGRLLQHFHEQQKPTVLICHAPAALAAAPDVAGKWLYEGYRMTCVNMLSERLIEDIPPFKVMHGHLSDYPERILRRKGANMQQLPVPMWSHVVEDRELLTGQDPYAAVALGKRWAAKLNAYLHAKQG